jgi:selenocysteine lyase/cysteine desulfurase
LNISELGLDYVAVHGYKWLLGPRGLGWLYADRRHIGRLNPLAPSWASVDEPYATFQGGDYENDLASNIHRLDFGPPWFLPAAAAVALNLLIAVNPNQLEAHCLRLANHVRSAIPKHVIDSDLPSHIVGIKVEDGASLRHKLRELGIRVAHRETCLRVGFHGFNTEQDVERLLAAFTNLKCWS